MRWGKLEKLMAALSGCWPDGGSAWPVVRWRSRGSCSLRRLTGRGVRIGCGVVTLAGFAGLAGLAPLAARLTGGEPGRSLPRPGRVWRFGMPTSGQDRLTIPFLAGRSNWAGALGVRVTGSQRVMRSAVTGSSRIRPEGFNWSRNE